MQKKIKRKLCMLVLCAVVCMVSLPAYAQTVNFNITVSESERKDPISKRAAKADGEQKYYVTVTSGSGTGVLRAHSERLDGRVISESVNISAGSAGQKNSEKYYTQANAGAYYFLNTYWGSGSGEVHLYGRYTP